MLAHHSVTSIWLPIFAGAALLHPAGDQSFANEEKKMSDRANTSAIIERLPSKNAAPELQEVDQGRGRPVFPDDYDWKEQVRVLAAVEELLDEKSVDGWEELFRHFDDSRYCVTLALEAEASWGRNFTVANICKSAAYSQLTAVLRQTRLLLDGRPIGAFGTRDLKEWRQQHDAQSLYELQIELCKLAREKVGSPRFKAVWPRRSPELDAALQAEIEELSGTKRPVLARGTLFLSYSPQPYLPQRFWPKDDGAHGVMRRQVRSYGARQTFRGRRRQPGAQESDSIDATRPKR